MSRPARWGLVAAAMAMSTVAACSSSSPTPVPTTTPSVAAPPSAAPGSGSTACGDPVASYAPPSPMPAARAMPAGSRMAEIQARGRLIAGVSADTYLLSSRNPLTGAIEGFDMDIVRAIANAILGPDAKVEVRVITAADRVQVLQEGSVDVVVRAMSMTCDRWAQVGFSAEYLHAGQKLLIRKGSGITGFADLGGRSVCAPANTTTLSNLTRLAPEATAVGARNHTECLVDLQQGRVDAITGDAPILAGLAAQDPYAEVLPGAPVTDEPYGVAVAKSHRDLTAFINGVLVRMRADGSWVRSYTRWLAPTLGAATQPTPKYGRL